MVRPYKTIQPKLGARAWVDVSAQVIGDVELGDDASVWMSSVVRGDVNRIRIGARTNVQDDCVLHVTALHPTTLAEDVTVGHSVTLHGCTVERLCLIGIGAIVLNGAVVGEESIVAAGALVPEGMQVPPRSLVMGVAGQGPPAHHRGGAGRPAPLRGALRRAEGRLPHRGGGRLVIQAVRGTRDILPDEVPAWHAIETAARELFARYGYREIRTPVFEATELFARGIGAETDIVSKEMYTFEDRDGGSLTLRPEATAGIVRAVIEHNLVAHRPGSQGLRSRTDVPPRAAAEGPLPAVPPGGRGGLRLHEPDDRRRGGGARPRVPRRLRRQAARARPQLRRRPQLPAGLRRDAARARCARSRRRCAATASAGPRRTRCASSTARCRRTRRRSTRSRASPTTSAPSATTTSPRSAGSSSSSASATA